MSWILFDDQSRLSKVLTYLKEKNERKKRIYIQFSFFLLLTSLLDFVIVTLFLFFSFIFLYILFRFLLFFLSFFIHSFTHTSTYYYRRRLLWKWPLLRLLVLLRFLYILTLVLFLIVVLIEHWYRSIDQHST